MMNLSKKSSSKIGIAKLLEIKTIFGFLKELIFQFYKPAGFMWTTKIPGSNWSALLAFRRNARASSTLILHRSRRRFQEESVALTELMSGYSDSAIVLAVSQYCETRPLLKKELQELLKSDS